MADCEDIDLNDPEVQAAAAKIQKGFRGHMTRKDKPPTTTPPGGPAAPTGALPPAEEGNTALDEELAAIDLTDPDLSNAALKIQAGFRGHMSRKEEKRGEQEDKPPEINSKPAVEEEEVDIDLTDPEVNKAALKIQATFRTHQFKRKN